LDRVKTGISGLDDLMEGGLPRGYCYTIVGGPGAGKTIFGLQFLHNGAIQYGENGIYITFDESPQSIRANAKRLGMDLEELEKAGKLVIIDASPIRMEVGRYVMKTPSTLGVQEFKIATVLSLLHDAKRKIDAKRAVVDSLTSLMVQYKDGFVIRKEALSLIKSLSEIAGLTSLLFSESGGEPDVGATSRVETFLVSGVIYLHNIKHGEERVRAVEILKMRGVNHSTKMHPFRITEKGIQVFPEERVY